MLYTLPMSSWPWKDTFLYWFLSSFYFWVNSLMFGSKYSFTSVISFVKVGILQGRNCKSPPFFAILRFKILTFCFEIWLISDSYYKKS